MGKRWIKKQLSERANAKSMAIARVNVNLYFAFQIFVYCFDSHFGKLFFKTHHYSQSSHFCFTRNCCTWLNISKVIKYVFANEPHAVAIMQTVFNPLIYLGNFLGTLYNFKLTFFYIKQQYSDRFFNCM